MPASAATESMFEGESATAMEAVDGNDSVLVTRVPKPRAGSSATKKPHSHRSGGVRQKEVSSRYGVNTPSNTASPPHTPARAHTFAASRHGKLADDMCDTPSDSSPSSASSSSSSFSASSIDGDDVGILDRMLSLDRFQRDPDAPFATASDFDISPGCGTLLDLPRELLVLCLTYLRPWDLSALALTAQHFNDYATFQQVAEPLLEKYGGAPAGSVDRSLGALLEGLRFQEVQHVHKLLSAPEPLPGQSGYWLSKSWATNHRRFAELMATKRKGALNGGNGKGRRSSLRERRESDVMPPWPDVNADITCEHGNLRPLNGSNGKNSSASFICKRRAVEKRAWRVLRRLYPEAKAFKTSVDECDVCSAKDREEKDRMEEAKRVREAERTSSPALERLFNRRTGSPTAHGLAPLDPGLYHVMPRCWLSQWRNYIRDPRVVRPRDPECALVLCEAHGLPLIPPHVMDFLTGVSNGRGLLSNLTSRSGVVCEILNPEEWDALGKVYKTDFCLTFSLDPEDLSILWSTDPCTRCDPAGYDESQITVRNRQRSWAL